VINQNEPWIPLARESGQPALIDLGDDARELMRGALEALLFVADEPLSIATLADAVRAAPADVAPLLDALSREYTASARGYELRQVAGGWRLYTRDRFADVVERYLQGGQQARLTKAALETLAIIAYRQPVTRARVAAIRGVSVDGLFRGLLARGLIEESQSGGSGGAFLYRTTAHFLEQLGLDELAELPSLGPLLPDTIEIEDESSST